MDNHAEVAVKVYNQIPNKHNSDANHPFTEAPDLYRSTIFRFTFS